MEFLDPDKMRRHTIMLYIGYILMGFAIIMTALILLYLSNGFTVNKDGEVLQNGLIFTASNPNGAQIYLDGQTTNSTTAKRLVLVAGDYVLQYKKTGYGDWSRQIQIRGGTVSRLDYAFLFPTNLETVAMSKVATAPLLSTQSPDRRWLLVQSGDNERQFSLYDLKDLTKSPTTFSLPASLVSTGGKSAWKLVEWSSDNVHVLLRHTYGKKKEFIVVNRDKPAESVNLNKKLAVDPNEVRLRNLKYDQYYLYDSKEAVLRTASLKFPSPLSYLEHVLAYKPYGQDKMLYVTDQVKKTPQDNAADKYAVKLADGDQTFTIRRIPQGTHYLLEMAGYSGDTYIAAGVDSEDKVLVYKNPVDQINNDSLGVAVPVTTLRVDNPDYISFSDSARFIMAENRNSFASYDAETESTYSYKLPEVMDKATAHATWMDGNRLTYSSGGTLVVFEADQNNKRSLLPVSGAYDPAFTPDYRQMVTIAPDGKAYQIQRTWLRIQADR